MADETEVTRLYDEAAAIINYLLGQGRVSESNSVADIYRKSLLLGCASYFEHILTNAVSQYVIEKSGKSTILHSLIKNKVINRQYHSWFDWDKGNGNKFYTMLGSEFKAAIGKDLKDDTILKKGESDFVELGNERNKLVHQNFSNFALELTLDEILSKYHSAVVYVNHVIACLNKYDTEHRPI